MSSDPGTGNFCRFFVLITIEVSPHYYTGGLRDRCCGDYNPHYLVEKFNEKMVFFGLQLPPPFGSNGGKKEIAIRAAPPPPSLFKNV